MALLYPWATKEYLLWEMTIGQIILYHNRGIEMKYGEAEKPSGPGLVDKSESELRELRDEARRQFEHDALAAKYGDIDG
jgi:hypothetical protein